MIHLAFSNPANFRDASRLVLRMARYAKSNKLSRITSSRWFDLSSSLLSCFSKNDKKLQGLTCRARDHMKEWSGGRIGTHRPQTYIRRTNPKGFCYQRSCHLHAASRRRSGNRKRRLHRHSRDDHQRDDATMNVGRYTVGSWCDLVKSANHGLRVYTHAEEVAWVSQSSRPHRLPEHHRMLSFPTAPATKKTKKRCLKRSHFYFNFYIYQILNLILFWIAW